MTEYCGERLNINNKPINLKSQLLNIINDRINYGIHNDIKIDQEILILDGKVKKYNDWGWGSQNKFQSSNV